MFMKLRYSYLFFCFLPLSFKWVGLERPFFCKHIFFKWHLNCLVDNREFERAVCCRNVNLNHLKSWLIVVAFTSLKLFVLRAPFCCWSSSCLFIHHLFFFFFSEIFFPQSWCHYGICFSWYNHILFGFWVSMLILCWWWRISSIYMYVG